MTGQPSEDVVLYLREGEFDDATCRKSRQVADGARACQVTSIDAVVAYLDGCDS